MLATILETLETLILEAPGNADVGAGEIWPTTLARLGESSVSVARTNRCFWDYLEASVDAGMSRPFFVLAEVEAQWDKYNLRDLSAEYVIEVAYTETALATAANHRASKDYFITFTANLIQSCALRSRDAIIPIAAIRQVVMPQRTPRVERDPDLAYTDYWWASWHFVIGETARFQQL